MAKDRLEDRRFLPSLLASVANMVCKSGRQELVVSRVQQVQEFGGLRPRCHALVLLILANDLPNRVWNKFQPKCDFSAKRNLHGLGMRSGNERCCCAL